MMTRFIASAIVSALLIACAGESDELTNGNGKGGRGGGDGTEDPNGVDPNAPPPGDPTQPGTCKEGVPHVGFAGTDFVQDRKAGGIGSERRRIKPYTALRTDFQRVLGNVPPGMNAAGAAFGDVPARWYAEPVSGAVALNTTYSLAFTGCYDSMTDAKYTAMPTPQTATAECTAWERKFWSRTGTADETKQCEDLIAGLAAEPVARRRWAHACAQVMTATGFTTY
jgi:hypothetical protein